MSFMKARQRSTEQPAASEEFSNRCAANGCPMRGTISAGGSRYTCACHFSAQPEQWSRVTESLHQNEAVRLAIAEVVKMGDIGWIRGDWQLMDRFFDNDPELQPSESERQHRRWYEYRLRNWLMYQAGLSARKPLPRDPLTPTKKRGNAAQWVAA